jgi:phosphopantothenoylcysteine decarboxylase/phosphopantothenate--cysteine ligase
MNLLKGKKILLCVGGGISAYKSVELLRHLKKEGCDVHVILSPAGEKFVGRTTFQAISEHPALVEMFDNTSEVEIKHVKLPSESELIVVAPATADIIGKLANGIANDLLSTSLLVPPPQKVLLCPAMNTGMWENPAVQENIEKLRKRGVNILEPAEGELACGFTGKGRMREPPEIMDAIKEFFSPKLFKGKKMLITAGPTREFIDDVRFISNPSSGKMGYSFAKVGKWMGAEVCLISGPAQLSPPSGVKLRKVVSAEEMLSAVKEEIKDADVIIKNAAVCDFKPKNRVKGKIKKEKGIPHIELEMTKDILKEIKGMKGRRIVVGFAAETSDLEINAKQKLKKKGLDFIVVNDVSRRDIGFESDENEGYVFTSSGEKHHIPKCSKEEFAYRVLELIARESKVSQSSGKYG